MKKLLVTGAGGLLGSHVLRLAQVRWETLGLLRRPAAVAGRTNTLDLTDSAGLEKVVREFRPDVIVHAGAMTAPVDCEKKPTEATRVNVESTAVLAGLAAALGARFIFLSTDIVFDGEKGSYREDDLPRPLSQYGRTKVAAEQETARRVANHVIIRTSLMVGYSPAANRSQNEVMKAALDRGETLQLFTDEYRCLIGAGNLAEVILELAERAETGLFHVAGPERRSRYEWGLLIARHFGWDCSRVQPVTRAQLPLVPPRPPDCSLDISKARRLLRTPIRTVAEELHALGR